MRKSISVTFFSMVATLLVLGTAVMGFSEWVLFNRYFAQERYETLDSVAEVTQRAADYVVQQAALPGGDELDALSDKLVIIGESAEAYLFFTDEDGSVLITSNPELLAKETVPQELIAKVGEDKPYHVLSTLDGVLTEKRHPELPETITNIIKCKNPRCITTTEQELPQVFKLTDREHRVYRCLYCEGQAK